MTTITNFDKRNVALLQAEATQALLQVAAKYGLKVSQAGGSFAATKFTGKFTFEVADPATMLAAERADFETAAFLYDVKPEAYGTTIDTTKYGPVVLVGFETGRPKFPVKVRKSDGALALFTKDLLLKLPANLREPVTSGHQSPVFRR